MPSTASVRLRHATVTAVAAGLVVAPLTAVAPQAGAVPQSERQAAPAPARVSIDGVYNARTFANYTTRDGRRLNDRVIRSGDLSKLTGAGLATLRRLDVRTVIDLRSAPERLVQPDRPVPFARSVHADVMAMAPLAGAADFPGMYRVFVDNPGARDAYRSSVLHIIRTASSGDTTVLHCTAGRDRTGWGSALILRILGVDMATIEADFMAARNGTDVNWLRGAFRHADALYGSFDGYVKRGLRLTDQDVDRLRAALTA